MSEILETPEQEVPIEVTAEIEPEKIYMYQPVDTEGRNMGGAQVLKYRTHEELVGKLQEQNTLLIRKLRAETRKNRLGILDNDVIPEDAPRFSSNTEFKPKDLTPDERYALSQDLMNPETAINATETLFEATIGTSPAKLRETLSSLQEDNAKLKAKMEADAFVAANSDYYICRENFDAIVGWILRYDLDPVKANFQRAYDTLKAQDVIIFAPEHKPTPVPAVIEEIPAVQTPRSPDEEQLVPRTPPPVYRVPSSGLTNDNSSSVGAPRSVSEDIVYEHRDEKGNLVKKFTGLAALNAMPGEEYKRRIFRDPTFAAKADKIYAEANKKK